MKFSEIVSVLHNQSPVVCLRLMSNCQLESKYNRSTLIKRIQLFMIIQLCLTVSRCQINVILSFKKL